MRAVGVVTTILLAALGSVAVVVGVRSIPDLQRYLKIRSM